MAPNTISIIIMPTYRVETVTGAQTITADRYAKDQHGDLLFFNGSTNTPPVADFIRENTVNILPGGSA